MLSVKTVQESYSYIKQYNSNNIMDGFYARLLINIEGFIEYVKDNDNGGCRTPMASKMPDFCGMSRHSIFKLIKDIREKKSGKPFENLRYCYDQIGFLIFVDDFNNPFVYAENFTNFENWINTAIEEGPSSMTVLNDY